jgi:hypothetical protein
MISTAALQEQHDISRNKLPQILMSNPIASVLQSSNFSAMNGKTPMSNGSSKL